MLHLIAELHERIPTPARLTKNV